MRAHEFLHAPGWHFLLSTMWHNKSASKSCHVECRWNCTESLTPLHVKKTRLIEPRQWWSGQERLYIQIIVDVETSSTNDHQCFPVFWSSKKYMACVCMQKVWFEKTRVDMNVRYVHQNYIFFRTYKKRLVDIFKNLSIISNFYLILSMFQQGNMKYLEKLS